MKSHQNIRLLIGLMSLALLGVIMIQFLWIRNAMKLKQEQFDHSVNMSMIRVSAQLENKYGVHFITEKLEKDSNAKTEMIRKDPGLYKFMISVDDEKKKAQEEKYLWRSKAGYVDAGHGSADEEISVSKAGRVLTKRSVIAMVNVSGNHKQEVLIRKNGKRIPMTPEPPKHPDLSEEALKTNLINIVSNIADNTS